MLALNIATKALYRKTRSGYDEEFKNWRLRSFVVLNKAKQGKGQLTLCFNVRQVQVQNQETWWKKAIPVFIEEILCDGPGRFPSHELYILVGKWDTPFSEPQAFPWHVFTRECGWTYLSCVKQQNLVSQKCSSSNVLQFMRKALQTDFSEQISLFVLLPLNINGSVMRQNQTELKSLINHWS